MVKHLIHTFQGSFEYDGTWWLPDNPDTRVPGKLNFDPEKGIYLNLMGSFVNPSFPIDDVFQCEVINGVTKDGIRCTLINNFTVGRWISFFGMTTEKYVSNLLILGEWLENNEALRFSSCQVSFDHLEEWITPNVFDFDFIRENNKTVGYSLKLETREFFKEHIEAGNFELSLTNHISGSNSDPKSRTLESEAFLKIAPAAPLDFYEFRVLVHDFSRLIALLIGDNTWPCKFHLTTAVADNAEEDSPPTTVNALYLLSSVHVTRTLYRNHMPVKFSTFVDNLPDIVNRWLSGKPGIQSAQNLFFLALYGEKINLENTFLSLVHALESYHRATYSGKYIGQDEYEQYREEIERKLPQNLPRDLKDALRARLKYGNEHSLRKRLSQLFNDLGDELVDLVTDSSDDFVNRIVDTRNYYVHFDEALKHKAMDAAQILSAQSRLALLVRILLLRELGFEDEQIYQMLHNKRKLLPRD